LNDLFPVVPIDLHLIVTLKFFYTAKRIHTPYRAKKEAIVDHNGVPDQAESFAAITASAN